MSTSYDSIKSLFASGTPLPLYRAQQIREAELAYAASNGKPLLRSETVTEETSGTWPLMERAGRAAFELLRQRWPDVKELLVVCGKGNNGGDGYVVAMLAAQSGINVSLVRLCEETDIHGDALIAWQKLNRCQFHRLEPEQINSLRPDLVVDALLGTGFKGELGGRYLQTVRQMNQLECPILAIDIPSGLEADTGVVRGAAVEATATMTFIGIKQGQMTADAFDYCGELYLADLGVENEYLIDAGSAAKAYRWQTVRDWIPKRRFNSHKGHYGHCLVVGGSQGMLGAAMLAAEASVRAGSGKTSAWVEQDAAMLVCRRPEVMARNVSPEEVAWLVENGQQPDTLVIGPGLGQSDWSRGILQALTESVWWGKCQKVIDADALNLLANSPYSVDNAVLTPHPGEAARLLGCSIKDVNQDRFAAAISIAQKFNSICLLKGAGTVIASASGELAICPVGHPSMATGGMGDVLSGIIGVFLNLMQNPMRAALIGCIFHGKKAEQVCNEAEKSALLPSELLGA